MHGRELNISCASERCRQSTSGMSSEEESSDSSAGGGRPSGGCGCCCPCCSGACDCGAGAAAPANRVPGDGAASSAPSPPGALLSHLQLFARTGWFLCVRATGEVRGSADADDADTHLEFASTDVPGDVLVRCPTAGGLCLAMRRSGRVYAEPDPSSPNARWIEALHGSYNTYLSRRWAHLGYYLGLRRDGRIKRGSRTHLHQKAAHFLPRRTQT